MDTDSGTETVHIHRGKIRQLAGSVATTEIPSLGGEVCISTNANHNKKTLWLTSVSITWDMPMSLWRGSGQ